MKSIVSELEALQARCDRLTASREKRTEEVEKAMGRLREVWKPRILCRTRLRTAVCFCYWLYLPRDELMLNEVHPRLFV